MKLSVIIPVFSETTSVKNIVEEVKNILGEKLYEIIFIVAPKSIPESIKTCQDLAQDDERIKFYLQKNNPGVGRAYREGLDYVSGDYILFLDGDGQNDLSTINLMIKKIIDENLDLVVASRWIGRGGVNCKKYGFRKYIVNRIFHLIFRFLYKTKIHDLTFSYKLMKINLAKEIRWEGIGFEFNGETTLKPIKYGYKVGEICSVMSDRQEGKSKYSLVTGLRYIPMSLKILLNKKL